MIELIIFGVGPILIVVYLAIGWILYGMDIVDGFYIELGLFVLLCSLGLAAWVVSTL